MICRETVRPDHMGSGLVYLPMERIPGQCLCFPIAKAPIVTPSSVGYHCLEWLWVTRRHRSVRAEASRC